MEVPSTPTLVGTQNADFTRPLDHSTPHIGNRLSKRSQTGHIAAPGPLPYGGKTRKTTTAAVALQEGIEARHNFFAIFRFSTRNPPIQHSPHITLQKIDSKGLHSHWEFSAPESDKWRALQAGQRMERPPPPSRPAHRPPSTLSWWTKCKWSSPALLCHCMKPKCRL